MTISILLIEDNAADVYLVKSYLTQTGFLYNAITEIDTLKEGLALMQKQPFDVILLDLSLPDSQGISTLEKFIAAFPEANVIVLTGLARREVGLEAVRIGAQDFLMKGNFDAELLAKTLNFTLERKKVLASLSDAQKARALAEESSKIKEQFIANISHEMRTPMNAIFGMAHLLSKTPLNAEQADFVSSINNASEILLGIINDVLDFSTLQNSEIHFDNTAFNIHTLLFNVINVVQYKRNEKSLEFQLSIDENLPIIVKGDKLRLNQILFNIVGNAIKFTDVGLVRISTQTILVDETSVKVKFATQDTGIGIPADKVCAIFDSFVRVTTKERLFEGTGLGLAIVKNMVEQQNGKVWAESVLGKGTIVFVELQFDIADVQEVKNLQKEEKIAVPSTKIISSAPFKVLLVEDHKMNQVVAKKILQKLFPNIEIDIAENGRVCIDILASGAEYNLILMDIQMPILDGTEATAWIRNNLPDLKTPIWAMSAHAFMSKRDTYLAQGFNDFVLKPFHPDDLQERIERLMNA